MKEPRVEQIVNELKATVERLNRLDALLRKREVDYTLYRKQRDTPWLLENVTQKVEY